MKYVFQSGLFEQVALYIDPLNAASLAVAQKLGAELQGEKADGIAYRGAAKPALHRRFSAKSLNAQEGPTHNSKSSSPEFVERPAFEYELADGVYEFRRSLKNARL